VDLQAALSSQPGIAGVKLLRDAAGRSRGLAFVDFQTVGHAAALMEAYDAQGLALGGRALALDYSSGGGAAAAGASAAAQPPPLDWLCVACQGVNFARRVECHKCGAARPPDAPRVVPQGDTPSCTLKATGFEASLPEAVITAFFSAVGAQTVRCVHDRLTGAPRGVAFATFPSVAAATWARASCDGAAIAGSATPVRLAFGRDLFPASAGDALAAGAAAAGGGAAGECAAENWAPKEFDGEEREEGEEELGGGDAAAGAAETAAADGGGEASTSAAAGGGCTYDAASGLWYYPSTGLYYSAESGLFYDPASGAWAAYDAAAGGYVPVAQPAAAAAAAQTAVAQAQAQQQAPRPAATAGAAAPARRGAVIGAAPRLNPLGVLEAIRLAEERERQAAAAAKKAAARKAAAAPRRPGGAAPAPPPTAAPLAQPAAIEGVIHRGSGAWRQRQQQGQPPPPGRPPPPPGGV